MPILANWFPRLGFCVSSRFRKISVALRVILILVNVHIDYYSPSPPKQEKRCPQRPFVRFELKQVPTILNFKDASALVTLVRLHRAKRIAVHLSQGHLVSTLRLQPSDARGNATGASQPMKQFLHIEWGLADCMSFHPYISIFQSYFTKSSLSSLLSSSQFMAPKPLPGPEELALLRKRLTFLEDSMNVGNHGLFRMEMESLVNSLVRVFFPITGSFVNQFRFLTGRSGGAYFRGYYPSGFCNMRTCF